MAASSALRRNKNLDYLKIYDSTNDRNSKTTRFNVAQDNNINCIICKKPGHVAENYYHLTKGQEAVSKKQNSNFVIQNQHLSTNYQQQEDNNNNTARNNYRNNHFLGKRNNNYNYNNLAHNNYPNNNILRNRNKN